MSSAAPKSVLYIRPDTIGDLVIFSSALAQLRAAWPNARHTLLVRPGYNGLAPLFPPGIHWEATPINPFTQKPSACRAQVVALLRTLGHIRPDVIVAATLNRTWLEVAVAARFPQARRVALGGREVDPFFATDLRLELGAEMSGAFPEIVPVEENLQEWEANHRLADHLTGRTGDRSPPTISVPAEAAAAAASFLAKHQLSAGRFAAVFPAGLANVAIKAWPAGRFAELVAWLTTTKKLPVLLLGHSREAALVQEIAESLEERGAARPPVWLGRDGELTLLAALLAQSRLYVGHDTGAMHLAAALNRPVVGIFGGGHWPRFRPAGRQSVSVVQPLPCFGCNWDCHFGDAPCVKTLAVADVRRGVEIALKRGAKAYNEIVEADNLPSATVRLIAAATPRYRTLQHDRLERQHKIEELKRETDGKDTEIADLKRESDDKDREIADLKRESDGKDQEIVDLKRESDGKDREIADLKRESDGKDHEIAELKRESDGKDREIAGLKRESDGKDTEIVGLKSESDTKDGEIAGLKDVCNEREVLIFTQDGHIKNFQKMVAELNTAIAATQAQTEAVRADGEGRIAALAAEKTRLESLFAGLPPGTLDFAATLHGKDAHIRHLEQVVAETRASLANYTAGHATLEHSKHYVRLLAEKEAVIQHLHRACVEREALIKQLTLDATRPGAGLRKLGTAAAGHVRLKWWRPFNEWLFHKVVEDYWMQIGVLQQYPPRPIRWDRRLRKHPGVPVRNLPQIAVVTPSYDQPAFIESTMLSVLNQNYPRLLYVVQDGGSPEPTPQIIARYGDRLAAWVSAPDGGQSDAVRRGFDCIADRLRGNDVMSWLNSDDFINPRALGFVGAYFATHPRVDAVYGHRIIINEFDQEIGRWILPRHEARSLEWIDYVPQETLFFRKRAWDRVGGVDPTFQFALDWDLLARFTQAGLRVVRLPFFLGTFRVHAAQKTSAAIHTTGADEMRRVRALFHGDERPGEQEKINAWSRRIRFTGALTARLHRLGIRW